MLVTLAAGFIVAHIVHNIPAGGSGRSPAPPDIATPSVLIEGADHRGRAN